MALKIFGSLCSSGDRLISNYPLITLTKFKLKRKEKLKYLVQRIKSQKCNLDKKCHETFLLNCQTKNGIQNKRTKLLQKWSKASNYHEKCMHVCVYDILLKNAHNFKLPTNFLMPFHSNTSHYFQNCTASKMQLQTGCDNRLSGLLYRNGSLNEILMRK